MFISDRVKDFQMTRQILPGFTAVMSLKMDLATRAGVYYTSNQSKSKLLMALSLPQHPSELQCKDSCQDCKECNELPSRGYLNEICEYSCSLCSLCNFSANEWT